MYQTSRPAPLQKMVSSFHTVEVACVSAWAQQVICKAYTTMLRRSSMSLHHVSNAHWPNFHWWICPRRASVHNRPLADRTLDYTIGYFSFGGFFRHALQWIIFHRHAAVWEDVGNCECYFRSLGAFSGVVSATCRAVPQSHYCFSVGSGVTHQVSALIQFHAQIRGLRFCRMRLEATNKGHQEHNYGTGAHSGRHRGASHSSTHNLSATSLLACLRTIVITCTLSAETGG